MTTVLAPPAEKSIDGFPRGPASSPRADLSRVLHHHPPTTHQLSLCGRLELLSRLCHRVNDHTSSQRQQAQQLLRTALEDFDSDTVKVAVPLGYSLSDEMQDLLATARGIMTVCEIHSPTTCQLAEAYLCAFEELSESAPETFDTLFDRWTLLKKHLLAQSLEL